MKSTLTILFMLCGCAAQPVAGDNPAGGSKNDNPGVDMGVVTDDAGTIYAHGCSQATIDSLIAECTTECEPRGSRGIIGCHALLPEGGDVKGEGTPCASDADCQGNAHSGGQVCVHPGDGDPRGPATTCRVQNRYVAPCACSRQACGDISDPNQCKAAGCTYGPDTVNGGRDACLSG
jgi:hypothetical protein